MVLFLEPGEFDGPVLALVWGDSPDICLTFLEASSSLVTCWNVKGLSSQSLPGPRRPHWSWDKRTCQPLAETERWKRKGSLTADLGKITAEAAGLKKECVRQNLFGLNYL